MKGRRRALQDLRLMATAIVALQSAEAMRIHALRDRCRPCAYKVAAIVNFYVPYVPKRHLEDKHWIHKRIEMPGARIAARELDEVMDPDNWAP